MTSMRMRLFFCLSFVHVWGVGGGWGGGGACTPLYNQNPFFTTRIPRNPHFATGCEGFLASL